MKTKVLPVFTFVVLLGAWALALEAQQDESAKNTPPDIPQTLPAKLVTGKCPGTVTLKIPTVYGQAKSPLFVEKDGEKSESLLWPTYTQNPETFKARFLFNNRDWCGGNVDLHFTNASGHFATMRVTLPRAASVPPKRAENGPSPTPTPSPSPSPSPTSQPSATATPPRPPANPTPQTTQNPDEIFAFDLLLKLTLSILALVTIITAVLVWWYWRLERIIITLSDNLLRTTGDIISQMSLSFTRLENAIQRLTNPPPSPGPQPASTPKQPVDGETPVKPVEERRSPYSKEFSYSILVQEYNYALIHSSDQDGFIQKYRPKRIEITNSAETAVRGEEPVFRENDRGDLFVIDLDGRYYVVPSFAHKWSSDIGRTWKYFFDWSEGTQERLASPATASWDYDRWIPESRGSLARGA